MVFNFYKNYLINIKNMYIRVYPFSDRDENEIKKS